MIRLYEGVSIRAPAKGATSRRNATRPMQSTDCFNPRPREGGDPSTLVPPGDVRAAFQSAPPRRGRRLPRDASISGAVALFQSAPPRRGRPHPPSRGLSACAACFNPRPREGGDTLWSGCHAYRDSLKFQSAPPRRGRRLPSREPPGNITLPVSIRAPAKGATFLTRCQPAGHRRSTFQSAPPRRGRRHHGRPRLSSVP